MLSSLTTLPARLGGVATARDICAKDTDHQEGHGENEEENQRGECRSRVEVILTHVFDHKLGDRSRGEFDDDEIKMTGRSYIRRASSVLKGQRP